MKRKRHQLNKCKSEDNKDMLSNLPDCALLHILSFLNDRDAVRTCILSKRWKHLRKRLCCYSEHILPSLFSCSCYIEHIPPSLLFSCSSLTSLDLRLSRTCRAIVFPDSLNFPALTNLKLRNFSFSPGNNGRIEPFSTFNRLNTLLIDDCVFWNKQQPLCISSTTLLNLAIDDRLYDGRYLKIELSTPNLCAFAFRGVPLVKFHGSSLSSIKQVNIEIDRGPHECRILSCLLNWFKEMTNINSLTVCPRILQALSLILDILKLKFTSLCYLKSLKLNLNLDSYRLPTISWRDIKLELKSHNFNLDVDSYRFPVISWRDIMLELAGGKLCNKNDKFRKLEPICLSTLDGMIEFLLQNSRSAKFVTVLPNSLSNIF